MITEALLAGGATLVVAVGLYQRWLSTLPRSVCPCCGEQTTAVSHPLWAHAERWVRRRWCTACGWKGWGRNGPMLWPGKEPVSHRSGFRWGPERLESDFGFRWADRPDADAPPASPAHPSGFRWASLPGAPTTDAGPVAHPAGFRFRQGADAASEDAAHPSGFRWAGSRPGPTSATASFRWRN
jgi:hypothetical protein